MKRGLCGVLLAAGQSTRFGSNKLLHPMESGVPMVVASARKLYSALDNTVAVVENVNSEVADLLAGEGLSLVENRRALEGMGTSISAGVAASQAASGWLITLADMPFIQVQTIIRLVSTLESGARLALPVYRGRRGHPVGFAAQFGGDLQSLRGDQGARHLLDDNRDDWTVVEVDDVGVIADVDSPEQVYPHPRPAGGMSPDPG